MKITDFVNVLWVGKPFWIDGNPKNTYSQSDKFGGLQKNAVIQAFNEENLGDCVS